MKVTSLKEVNKIDSDIQFLLGQLSELYKTREALFNENKKNSSTQLKHNRKKTSLQSLDLNEFDLTLRD